MDSNLKNELKNLNIVFFDGYCNLCNNLVKFLLRFDKKDKLWFASQQSEFAQGFINKNLEGINAVIFYSSGKVYVKSDAVIKIFNKLGGIWKLSSISFAVPLFIRNFFYDWISRKRYYWFGKSDFCYLPETKFKNKFLGLEEIKK